MEIQNVAYTADYLEAIIGTIVEKEKFLDNV